MDLPFHHFLASINEKVFGVIYFKDKKYSLDAPPHNYVLVPTDKSHCLVVCIITSQIDKRKRYYKNSNVSALESLIEVDSKDFPFLSKPSLIDCNLVEMISKTGFESRVEKSFKFEMRERGRSFPEKLQAAILQAIKKSPLVGPYIKNSIIDPPISSPPDSDGSQIRS